MKLLIINLNIDLYIIYLLIILKHNNYILIYIHNLINQYMSNHMMYHYNKIHIHNHMKEHMYMNLMNLSIFNLILLMHL